MNELLTIPDLVDDRDPILSTPTPVFDFANPPTDPIELAHLLAQAMIKYRGMGISANQLGLPYRVFAMSTNPVTICYNPKIVDIGQDQVLLDEGCLSVPGVSLKIKRAKNIKVRFTQANGETVTHTFTGMTARIFQHEFDHQEGKNFMDLVGPLQKKLALKKLAKRKKIEALRKQFVRK